MTLSDNVPQSRGAQIGDRQPHGDGVGGRPGPNKDATSRPSGGGALGNEIGGEADAQRERAQALREGDQLPPIDSNLGGGLAGGSGFGQLNGAEKGYGQGPTYGERQDNQQEKNAAASGDGPLDAGAIAKHSAGSANFNPTQDPQGVRSTANSRPEEILDTASRSGGTESGFGAYRGGIVNQAGTDNVAE